MNRVWCAVEDPYLSSYFVTDTEIMGSIEDHYILMPETPPGYTAFTCCWPKDLIQDANGGECDFEKLFKENYSIEWYDINTDGICYLIGLFAEKDNAVKYIEAVKANGDIWQIEKNIESCLKDSVVDESLLEELRTRLAELKERKANG